MLKKRFVLIDAPAIVHRAFHAIPPLTTKDGRLVNAAYGFCMIFLNMIRDLKPNLIATTFDLKEPTFRHIAFKEYKAKRIRAPQELYDQIPLIKEILTAMNVPILEKPGFEADDIIGTIQKKVKNEVDEIIIVTGDLDTLQLVDGKTRVYTMRRGITDTFTYDEKEVENRFSLLPDQLIDYKALRGDPSDNIPGIAGIGEKTASELIKEYGSIENLYRDFEKLSPKIQNLLQGKEDKIELSKKLVTIDQNVPIDFSLKNASIGDFDRMKVVKIFQNLEFKSLLAKLPDSNKISQKTLFEDVKAEPKKITENDYKIVQTDKEIRELIKNLENSSGFAVDTETDYLDSISGKLIGISISYKPGQAFYIPIYSINVIQKLKPVLENPKIAKYGHNLKYDYLVFKRCGVDLKPLSFDTMLASYLLNPQTRAHNLDQVAFVELGHETIPISDLIGSGKNIKKLSKAPVHKIAEYSCEDADIALRLYNHFQPQLEKGYLKKLFWEIEMPLVKILADMEKAGIKLDTEYLKKINQKVSQKIIKIKAKIHQIAGHEFNISSTQQLREILFNKLQISTDEIKKTKTGHSTAASELEKLKGKHEIIDLIREYRELTKLKNTYLEALPRIVNSETKRLHTSFNQTITTTGRLSSSEPNLQNIPVRTELGREIRKAFVAQKGYQILSCDYSQIELRIIASISKDPKMLEAFEKKEDIHTATAAEIFNTTLEKVTSEMRRVAKTVNFGVLYGMSPYGLAISLGISQGEAKTFIKKYFTAYAGVRNYIVDTINKARDVGYVETLLQRRRYLPEIHSGVPQVRNAAERMAINMPAQGTAADIIKIAMIEIARYLETNKSKTKMLLQVHDELVFEVPVNELKSVGEKIKEIMENTYKLDVPLIVDIKSGPNWQEVE